MVTQRPKEPPTFETLAQKLRYGPKRKRGTERKKKEKSGTAIYGELTSRQRAIVNRTQVKIQTSSEMST